MELSPKKFGPGFTLIELLTVISVIAVLSALILGTAGYIQRKAATSRAQSEIKAMEAACESYKADNGTYPMDSGSTTAATNVLHTSGGSINYDPGSFDASAYKAACAVLYQAITGDGNNKINSGGAASSGKMASAGKCYMELKPSQTGSDSGFYIMDPFGYSYGYSTIQSPPPLGTGSNGNNATFDLWSTAGTTNASTSGSQAKWITNW